MVCLLSDISKYLLYLVDARHKYFCKCTAVFKCDWHKNLANEKRNRNQLHLVRVIIAALLQQVTGNFKEFLLVHCSVCSWCDRSEYLSWYWVLTVIHKPLYTLINLSVVFPCPMPQRPMTFLFAPAGLIVLSVRTCQTHEWRTSKAKKTKEHETVKTTTKSQLGLANNIMKQVPQVFTLKWTLTELRYLSLSV